MSALKNTSSPFASFAISVFVAHALIYLPLSQTDAHEVVEEPWRAHCSGPQTAQLGCDGCSYLAALERLTECEENDDDGDRMHLRVVAWQPLYGPCTSLGENPTRTLRGGELLDRAPKTSPPRVV